MTVPAGMVIGVASAAPRVLSVGEGGAVFEALEISPPEPGVDVAAGWPAGAGSLLAFGLFPQAVENMQRLAMRGRLNFLRSKGVTRFSPDVKRNLSRSEVLARSAVASNCNREHVK